MFLFKSYKKSLDKLYTHGINKKKMIDYFQLIMYYYTPEEFSIFINSLENINYTPFIKLLNENNIINLENNNLLISNYFTHMKPTENIKSFINILISEEPTLYKYFNDDIINDKNKELYNTYYAPKFVFVQKYKYDIYNPFYLFGDKNTSQHIQHLNITNYKPKFNLKYNSYPINNINIDKFNPF